MLSDGEEEDDGSEDEEDDEVTSGDLSEGEDEDE
jgi:hypothetical protein